MCDVVVYVKENEWEKVFKLWEQVFKVVKNDKKKMCVVFNLVLYYEMKDSVEEVYKWVVIVQELVCKIDKIDMLKRNDIDLSEIFNYYLISFYVNELKERSNGLGKLKG